jgi:integrase
MPSFRSQKKQARHAVSEKIALGKKRHNNKDDGHIHSLGTARCYEQALKNFVGHIQKHKLGDLCSVTEETARQYLDHRSALVKQKTLDLDRQAIQMHLGVRLEVVKSSLETLHSTRSYTLAQVERIATAQSYKYGLSTRIAHAAGLRAHELLTLLPVRERPASAHRKWYAERFAGRQGERYTVEGKGGLIREVLISHDLAAQLESRRLVTPHMITDRGVKYQQHYNIGGGKNWSQSVTSTAQRELGWSTGAHGFRHTYAKERMSELQKNGKTYEDAKEIVAQEVGHFDKDTTEAYLR